MNSIHLKSINDLCEVGLTHEIKHPLVAVIEFDKISHAALPYGMQGTIDCYCIMFKKHCPNVLRYGMQEIDFHEGSLLCMAPNQVIEIGNETEIKNGIEGWCLLFHPDLIRDTSLGSNIKCYSFFSYDTSEALHLSDKEQKTLYECIANIQRELNDNIDQYTQNLIVSNIELLLNGSSDISSDSTVVMKKTAEQIVYLNNDKQIYSYEQQFSISCVGSLQP